MTRAALGWSVKEFVSGVEHGAHSPGTAPSSPHSSSSSSGAGQAPHFLFLVLLEEGVGQGVPARMLAHMHGGGRGWNERFCAPDFCAQGKCPSCSPIGTVLTGVTLWSVFKSQDSLLS